LFRSLLRRLLDDFADLGGSPGASDRAVLAARLHNLKGSAGTLGARSIAALAAQGEEFCRAHDAQNMERTLRQLAAELDALRQHAMPWLQEQDDDMPEPGPGTLDAAAVKELLEQLRRSDLAALDRFQRLAPQLRGLLGSRDFSRVRQQMDNLRFAEAASALERMAER
jgi:HPt (histidine-containing phosphotransfer) domain-containing protein